MSGLFELTGRALFALDRPALPLIAACIPVLVNVTMTLALNSPEPRWLGLGESVGLMAGFMVLFVAAHARRYWMGELTGAGGLALSESEDVARRYLDEAGVAAID